MCLGKSLVTGVLISTQLSSPAVVARFLSMDAIFYWACDGHHLVRIHVQRPLLKVIAFL